MTQDQWGFTILTLTKNIVNDLKLAEHKARRPLRSLYQDLGQCSNFVSIGATNVGFWAKLCDLYKKVIIALIYNTVYMVTLFTFYNCGK